VGLLFAVVGVGIMLMFTRVLVIGSVGFIAAIGVAMLFTGLRDIREDARREAELDRVDREWPKIVALAAPAIREGKGLPRVLQNLGFSYTVRQWVQIRLTEERVGMPCLEDPEIGDLVLDRELGALVREIQILGAPVALEIEPDASGNTEPALAGARRIVRDPEGHAAKAMDLLVAEFLELKNTSWLRGDEPPMTEEKLRQRTHLTAIRVHPDKTTSYSYMTGATFAHHGVWLVLGPDGQLVESGLTG
jgi:hypothetical protein